MGKSMVTQLRERRSIQQEASKYIVSICDLCVRAKPDVECEDYNPVGVEQCPEVYCALYREKIPRGGMKERAGWKTECDMFAPDVHRIRSVMAHAAMRNAEELAALDALLNG